MKKTTLILIRHGETEFNRSGVIQGHVDSKLTDTGEEQAKKLGERLQDKKIDLLFHSDLGRAEQTAGLLNLSIPTQADERIREISCGIAEGKDFEQVRAEHPEEYAKWRSESPDYGFPDGETFEQVQTRMYDAILDFAKSHHGKRIAIVSHGMALKLFLKRITNVPLGQPSGWYLRNTSISRVHYEPDEVWKLFSFGDVGHLDHV